jgi:hypothetical protein
MRWAFSDESRRGGRLVVTAAVVETRDVNSVRGELRRFQRPNQRRVHMAKESPARRRQFAALVGGLPIECRAVATVLDGRSMPNARQPVMAALTAELIAMRVGSWVIESVEPVQDRRDRRVIAEAVRRLDHRDEFVYAHRPPHAEPLLWAADGLAWLALERQSTEIDVIDVP